jgi:hypothetical protein
VGGAFRAFSALRGTCDSLKIRPREAVTLTLRIVRYLTLLALALVITACGGNATPKAAPSSPAAATSTAGSPAPSPSSTPTTPDVSAALRAAVQAYSDAYLTGRGGAAYALLSARCQRRWSAGDFSDLVTQAKAQYGHALPLRSFKPEISGDLARVTYTFDVAEIDQDAEPWVREDGSWHEDDC